MVLVWKNVNSAQSPEVNRRGDFSGNGKCYYRWRFRAGGKGSTILQAAQKAGINIPTLCYLKDVNQIGACRVCLVEVKGAKALQPSCVYPVTEGLEVMTNTAKVREARKGVVELLLSNHPADC